MKTNQVSTEYQSPQLSVIEQKWAVCSSSSFGFGFIDDSLIIENEEQF